MRAIARLLIVPVVTGMSVALCAVCWGEVRPVCARAWRMRETPFWGRYIACVDRLAAWYEPGHCERSAGRWG